MGYFFQVSFGQSLSFALKEETEQAPSWAILWTLCPDTICPVSMEMTYQLENQAPGRKSLRALHCLKEYPNYLCNRIESYILLCLLGYDHKPIDNCSLFNYLGLRLMNHGLTLIVSFFLLCSENFGEVGLSTYT